MKKVIARNMFELMLQLRQYIHTYGEDISDGIVPLDELKKLDDELGVVSKKVFDYSIENN